MATGSSKKPDEWRKSVVLKPSQHAAIIREIERRAKAHEGKYSGVLRDLIVAKVEADLEGKSDESPSSQLGEIRDILTKLQTGLSTPLPSSEGPEEQPPARQPVRLFDLAKQLGLDSKELIAICHQLGIPVKGSALGSLTADEANRVRIAAPQVANDAKYQAEVQARLDELRSLVRDVMAILRPDFAGIQNFIRRFEEAVSGLREDPFEMLINLGDYARNLRDSGLAPGKVVTAKISGFDDPWVYVELPGQFTGRLDTSSIPNSDGKADISELLSEGQVVNVEVLRVSLDRPDDITVKLATVSTG